MGKKREAAGQSGSLYDDYSRDILNKAEADMVGLFVFNGLHGSGLAVTHHFIQGRSERQMQVAKALRVMAELIEAKSQGIN